ncbi:MAG: hypothetical protein KGJ79_09390 [Alphaproteobacteria bacterium]|nr:hypothetical protein [Alphaproteobacteria bacterium]MDE2495604.1 hypothetical protein [Alphaproteobacteria bacterium]
MLQSANPVLQQSWRWLRRLLAIITAGLGAVITTLSVSGIAIYAYQTLNGPRPLAGLAVMVIVLIYLGPIVLIGVTVLAGGFLLWPRR